MVVVMVKQIIIDNDKKWDTAAGGRLLLLDYGCIEEVFEYRISNEWQLETRTRYLPTRQKLNSMPPKKHS
jgi:hypothetical protein